MPRYSGFTLIELLVAVSVFAVISAVSYGTLIQVSDAQERLVSEHQRWSQLAITFQRLADDLAHARNRPIRGVRGETIPALVGLPTDPRPLAPPTLELTRGGEWRLMDSTTPNISRIAWRLAEGKLVREAWPALDRAPTATPTTATMLADVESFEARYFHPRTGWQQRWPVPETGMPLPAGIEITLVRRNAEPLVRVFIVND